MPISRIRARKYKTQANNNQTARRSSTRMLSDEEGNTSEYSHPPSSVHSTLESNPDIAKIYKKQIKNQEQYSTRQMESRVDTMGACSQSVEISEDEDSSSDESNENATQLNTSNLTMIENTNAKIN